MGSSRRSGCVASKRATPPLLRAALSVLCRETSSREEGWHARSDISPDLALLSQTSFQQVQRRLGECPHIVLTVRLPRLQGDDAFNRACDRNAGVPGSVAIAIARRPARPGLAESPGGAELLAHRSRLQQSIGFCARPHARESLIG